MSLMKILNKMEPRIDSCDNLKNAFTLFTEFVVYIYPLKTF